jgi:UDP-glucose 4-epimerase
VTGGAGMIGRRLVSRLAGRGIAVAVVDDLSSGLAMPAAATITHQCDIREGSEMFALMRDFRPDAVVHLAAMHHIPTCENDRARCLDINVVGTENVLNAATEVQAERIVLASSGAVYDWSDGPLREDISPTMARDNYALTKLSNESQLRLWSERIGGIGRVARIFNAIGGDDPNAHLLPDILAQLQGDQSISTVRLGNLESRRDYLHADEVADGVMAVLMDHRRQPFDVFNLCSGEEHSVEGLVDCLATCLGRPFRIEVDEARRRRRDRPSQLGAPNKTSALLGWRAKRDLRGVLEHLLAERSLA